MKGEETPMKKLKAAAAAATEIKEPKREALDDKRPATEGKKSKPWHSEADLTSGERSSKKKKAHQQGEEVAAATPAAAKLNGKPQPSPKQQAKQQQQQQQQGEGQQQPKPYKNKKRKRKAGAPEDDSSLPSEERERRRRQKELHDLALRLRAQGQKYNPHRARQQKLKEKERGHKPRRLVQLIIVPIYWNKKADEKDSVLEAAERVQQLLRGAGVKCDTDTTNEKTPGQKFRYWEERGVRLRVELGPKEAAAGRCVLARCKNPGEVAGKTHLEVGEALLAAVHAALGTADATHQAAGVVATAGGGVELVQQEKPKNKVKQVGIQQAQEEEGAGHPKGPAELQPVGGKSGDALEDDFATLQARQQQEAAAAGKKGKKGMRCGLGGGAAQQAGDEEGLRVLLAGSGEKGKNAKTPKAVKF